MFETKYGNKPILKHLVNHLILGAILNNGDFIQKDLELSSTMRVKATHSRLGSS